MKFSHIVAVLALLGISTQAASIQDKLEQDRVNKLFSGFVSKFKRNYRNNGEFQNRLSNFQKNLKLVEEHNAQNKDFQLETNKFADLSDEEFQHMMGLNAAALNEATINAQADPYFPNVYSQQCDTEPVVGGVDWRTQGIISNVKNQASCGGCYAFSALESLQAYYHMKKGKASSPTSVINLSEQQIVDCSSSYGNNGCNGGLMSNSYNYLKAYPIMLEADYAYTAKKGTCQYAAAKGQFKVTSYVNLPKNDPAALLAAVKNQPISVALRAGSSVVQLYKSGVITSTACGTAIDHAVTLIGYGTEGGNDYWLLKNSWGESWGEKGYFKILRTTAKDAGICGILSLSSYPTGISI